MAKKKSGSKHQEVPGRASDKSAVPPPAKDSAPREIEVGILAIIREWSDALVIAFVLAMFIRVFVVELFKIPTGSMTPTLLGDFVAEVDLDDDDDKDLVVLGNRNFVFENKGERFGFSQPLTDSYGGAKSERALQERGLIHAQYDRILVSKFAYWRDSPDRGDVVVFKVPEIIWEAEKPIYIKRAIGLPGDTISFDGRLVANGETVEEPEFFQHQYYIPINGDPGKFPRLDYADYESGAEWAGGLKITEVRVPEDGVFVCGDHTRSSLDSRYWGVVPLDNLKGKAFMRYWPLWTLERKSGFPWVDIEWKIKFIR